MEAHSAPAYVLVVDDDEQQVEFIRGVLEASGFRVTAAFNCREARKRLSEGTYEVLLVDLHLPDGDGLDLLTLARERDPHTVAVVLTAYGSLETAVAALRRGAYDYQLKPCAPELLTAAVRRAAERQRLLTALDQRAAELEKANLDLDRRVKDATRQIFLLNERLKRFVVQLLHNNEAQVRFMENATHELKNPLFVVNGYAHHLLQRPMAEWSHDEVGSALQAIARNSDMLYALIEELLEATRLSAQKIELRLEKVKAGAEAVDAAAAFQPQARAKDISLASDAPDEGPVMDADPNRLRQVLNNLLSNAVKFTPRGGRIAVSVKAEGEFVRFTVKDSGPGIPPEHLERVFERFYQTEADHRQKGLGLGLEISRGLVILHGGRIWAESEPGKGASFHFTVPVRAPDQTQLQAREPIPQPEKQKSA